MTTIDTLQSTQTQSPRTVTNSVLAAHVALTAFTSADGLKPSHPLYPTDTMEPLVVDPISGATHVVLPSKQPQTSAAPWWTGLFAAENEAYVPDRKTTVVRHPAAKDLGGAKRLSDAFAILGNMNPPYVDEAGNKHPPTNPTPPPPPLQQFGAVAVPTPSATGGGGGGDPGPSTGSDLGVACGALALATLISAVAF